MTVGYGNLRDTTMETTNWLLTGILIVLVSIFAELAILLVTNT